MPPSASPGISPEPPAVHGPLPGDDETPRSTKRARELLYLFLDPTPPMRGGAGEKEGGRSLPFPARGCPHVALGLCILLQCAISRASSREPQMHQAQLRLQSAMHRAVRSKLMTGFVRSCKSLTGTAVQVWLGGGCMVHSQRGVWTY